MKFGRYFRVDTSALLLLLANILTIVFAVAYKWDINDVIWIYWAQSFIIGLFNFLHILDLKNFSTEGYDYLRPPFKMNIKSQMALFFIFHYGLLHIIFLVFLLYIWTITPSVSAIIFALCILAFFVTHGFAYWQNRPKDVNRKPNIGDIVFYPYARVLPMWLTLTLGMRYGQDSLFTLVLFLVLKTIADVIMHILDPMRKSMADIGHDRYPSSSETEEEKALEAGKVDLFKQNKPLSWWKFLWKLFKTGMEASYGPGVFKGWQGILSLIAYIFLIIFLISLFCAVEYGHK